MLSFTCHIYNYSTGTSRTFKIGGHYSGASWHNVFAYCLTESGTNLNVRWGFEGTSICVWIGETNSGWSYPNVFITDFQNGYSAIDGIWMTGWTVSLATAFDTITNGPTAAGYFWNQNNDGAGSGLDADLLDGYNSATANTANTIVLRDGSGNFSAGTITASSVVAGTLTETSSIRYKENIETIAEPILYKLNNIRPVTYNKKDNKDKKEYGIIAEELNDLFPEFVNKNDKGEIITGFHKRMKGISEDALKYAADKDFKGDYFKLYEYLLTGAKYEFILNPYKHSVSFEYVQGGIRSRGYQEFKRIVSF